MSRWPSSGSDRGASTVEYAVLFPILLLTLALAFHSGLWFLARSAALAAAKEGVRVARAHKSGASAGSSALRYARTVGDGYLLAPKARAGGDARTLEVTVTGRVPTFLPGVDVTISQVARAPREKFTTPRGGRR